MSTIDAKRATVDELFVSRDESGDIVPIEVYSPLLDRSITFRPIVYGWFKSHQRDLSVSAVEWSFEEKWEFIKDHLVEPDLSSFTEEQAAKQLDPMTLDHVCSLIISHSSPFLRLHRDREHDPSRLVELLKALMGGTSASDFVLSNIGSMSGDTNTPEKETSID